MGGGDCHPARRDHDLFFGDHYLSPRGSDLFPRDHDLFSEIDISSPEITISFSEIVISSWEIAISFSRSSSLSGRSRSLSGRSRALSQRLRSPSVSVGALRMKITIEPGRRENRSRVSADYSEVCARPENEDLALRLAAHGGRTRLISCPHNYPGTFLRSKEANEQITIVVCGLFDTDRDLSRIDRS